MFGIFDAGMAEQRKAATKNKVDGNLSGDGLTLGGTYVVEQGGKVLMEFQQKMFGDHPKVEDILAALNIDASELENRIKQPMK